MKSKIIPEGAILIPEKAERVFHGVIFDVYQWQQKMFDGSYETFEMLKRPDTVSVIPVIGSKLIALKQTQPGWSDYKLGFPGGRVDEEDESPLAAVKRELLEETGLSFKTWKLLQVIQREEKIEWFHYKYLATDLSERRMPASDAGEKLEVIEVDFDSAKQIAKEHPRMGAGLIEKYESLTDLLNTPEYNSELK